MGVRTLLPAAGPHPAALPASDILAIANFLVSASPCSVKGMLWFVHSRPPSDLRAGSKPTIRPETQHAGTANLLSGLPQ
eukprot:1147514-Pelagomonas_calceolata.AAC.6